MSHCPALPKKRITLWVGKNETVPPFPADAPYTILFCSGKDDVCSCTRELLRHNRVLVLRKQTGPDGGQT